MENRRSDDDVAENGFEKIIMWMKSRAGERVYPMMIIKHVVIGTDTWLVSFPDAVELEDDDPFSMRAPSRSVFAVLEDDVMELWSSSDMKLS